MIVVKLEVHSALTGEIKEIGRAIIANVGGALGRGDYKIRVARRQSDAKAFSNQDIFDNPLRVGSVQNYPRQSYNVWRLISRTLRAAFPEERD